MSFSIRYTPAFSKALKRLAKKFPSMREDYAALLKELGEDPMSGTPIGRGCYKVRMCFIPTRRGPSARKEKESPAARG